MASSFSWAEKCFCFLVIICFNPQVRNHWVKVRRFTSSSHVNSEAKVPFTFILWRLRCAIVVIPPRQRALIFYIHMLFIDGVVSLPLMNQCPYLLSVTCLVHSGGFVQHCSSLLEHVTPAWSSAVDNSAFQWHDRGTDPAKTQAAALQLTRCDTEWQ